MAPKQRIPRCGLVRLLWANSFRSWHILFGKITVSLTQLQLFFSFFDDLLQCHLSNDRCGGAGSLSGDTRWLELCFMARKSCRRHQVSITATYEHSGYNLRIDKICIKFRVKCAKVLSGRWSLQGHTNTHTHDHTNIPSFILLRTEGYQFDRFHFANNLQIGDSRGCGLQP